jgi:ribosomal protein S18 acetylase RimI-like enzyme
VDLKGAERLDFKIRDIEPRDIPFLWEMLYQSLYVPEGEDPFPRDILNEPYIAKYIDDWGQKGDIGLLAEKSNHPVGAAWLRLFSGENKGFGYVDSTTPDIGIALDEAYRGKGLGSRLMQELETRAITHGYKKLSLSVDPANPARRLYERNGYIHVGWCDTSWTMVKNLI